VYAISPCDAAYARRATRGGGGGPPLFARDFSHRRRRGPVTARRGPVDRRTRRRRRLRSFRGESWDYDKDHGLLTGIINRSRRDGDSDTTTLHRWSERDGSRRYNAILVYRGIRRTRDNLAARSGFTLVARARRPAQCCIRRNGIITMYSLIAISAAVRHKTSERLLRALCSNNTFRRDRCRHLRVVRCSRTCKGHRPHPHTRAPIAREVICI